jgi:hypothetical protein
MLEQRQLNKPAPGDVNDAVFWEALRQTFQETKDELLQMVAEEDIDLDDPELKKEIQEHEEKIERLVEKHEPLLQKARSYASFVSDILEEADSRTKQQGRRTSETPLLKSEADIAEALEVISYYHPFIYIKLTRAVHSLAQEELETDPSMRQLSSDADGSAKVALLGLDRSWLAWGSLLHHLEEGDDAVLDALTQLSAIREATELAFPAARGFIRPGFDEQ